MGSGEEEERRLREEKECERPRRYRQGAMWEDNKDGIVERGCEIVYMQEENYTKSEIKSRK